MGARTRYFTALKGRESGREYPTTEVRYVCEFDFGPLEVKYDYEAIARDLTREKIESRGPNIWRYKELLPIEGEPTVGMQVGFTPLVRAKRLAERLGVKGELWVKNDTVCYPTLSFKDRVVSVALSRSKEFGYKTVACASTGNLANSVAANAASAGLECFVFIPCDLEPSKILGSQVYGANVIPIDGPYDKVNRLCSEVADKYKWAFANVNMRPYYAEGSKTMGFEIAEQLGWRLPDNVVVPMASGSLMCKVEKAFNEFKKLGFVEDTPVKIYGGQAEGCSPIAEAVKKGTDLIRPVEKPDTIVKSLAIGNPADGYYATHCIQNSGGFAENPSDAETIEGIRMLAECEGIFAETAGGVTVAATKRLLETGKLDPAGCTVLCITGNGLKTKECLEGQFTTHHAISPSLSAFDALFDRIGGAKGRTAKSEPALARA
jgi:threonine synthase